MSRIKYIIVHCSDSDFGDVSLIREWHKARGFNDIGYHAVILNGKLTSRLEFTSLNGSISLGRQLPIDGVLMGDQIGAHCISYNDNSVGICLIGKNKFSVFQYESLLNFCKNLMDKYDIPVENVLGHYETQHANGKTCPNFDMNLIRKSLKTGYMACDYAFMPKEFKDFD